MGEDLNPASLLWTLEGQSFLTVLSFLGFHRALPNNWIRYFSLRLCVFFFSFNFQLSTFNFLPLPARVQ